MRVDIVTIFPKMFEGIFSESILRIAREKNLLETHVHDLRDYTLDPHRKVDDRPFGGGPGMLLMAEPIFRAVEHVRANGAETSRLVMLTPQGRTLTQPWARELAQEEGLLILCGHYEGFDERVRDGLKPLELSVGDYVLSGGEVPAMVLVDGVARLIPGALGDPESTAEESFEGDLLEYPHYTRPRDFRGMTVPEVLISGDHEAVARWRREQAIKRTAERRQDLMARGAARPEAAAGEPAPEYLY